MAKRSRPRVTKIKGAVRASTEAVHVELYGGKHHARVTREADEEGRTVARVRVTDQWPIDRLRARGRLNERQWEAGDRFRRVFARAVLQGRYATLDLYRFDKGHGDGEGDHVADARIEVRSLLGLMGKTSSIAVWYIVGCGHALEDVALRMKHSGLPLNRHHLLGLVVAGLDVLADHYRLTE